MVPALPETSSCFSELSREELRQLLDSVPHSVRHYDKGDVLFHLMEEASRVGILLEGRVQAQKPFPDGSQINVSVRGPGELIGPAAVFSRQQRYPCAMVALEPSKVLMLDRDGLLSLMQKDLRILQSMMTELASTAYRLQQRLELLSYSGIARKAAFYLLMHVRQTGGDSVLIPESVSNWAMILNVSRPSLHRELRKLEESGLIRYTPPRIRILDPEGLERFLRKEDSAE